MRAALALVSSIGAATRAASVADPGVASSLAFPAAAPYEHMHGHLVRGLGQLVWSSACVVARPRANAEAPDSHDMAEMLRVPRSLTDQCLARLMTLKLVVAIDDGDTPACSWNRRSSVSMVATARRIGSTQGRGQ